jgi:serine protease
MKQRLTSISNQVRAGFALAFVVLLTAINSGAQNRYYYYYKEQRVPLTLHTGYLYFTFTQNLNKKQLQLFSSIHGFEVVKSGKDEVTRTLTKLNKDKRDTERTWLIVKMKSKHTDASYNNILNKARKEKTVETIAPFFEKKGEGKIALTNYLNVKLKFPGDTGLLVQKAKESNAEIVGRNKFMPLWYMLSVTKQSKLNALDIANQLFESGLFESAEPSFRYENLLQFTPNDPNYTGQWGLNNTGANGGTAGIDIRAPQAWEVTKGSRTVNVAVFDQGFEMNHPDLMANNLGTGFNSKTASAPSIVEGEHGTACAGIIGAAQNNHRGVSGVAPNIRLISISNPLYNYGTLTQDLANGINWAWMNGAAVISNSWYVPTPSTLVDNAITNALTSGRGGLGTIVVFASGNFNASVVYPANSNPAIIAVGAVERCGIRAGTTAAITPDPCDPWPGVSSSSGSSFGAEIDVVAPGASVYTTDIQGSAGYGPSDYISMFGGTSAACPFVAGVAALVLSVNPSLTHTQVEQIIEQTARKTGPYTYTATAGRPNGTWNNETGYGLVNALDAATRAISLLPGVPGSGFDLFSKDLPADIGIEPDPIAGAIYLSDDIWVRKNPDAGLTHENPEYKNFAPNAVYVRVRNRGTAPSAVANLSLYFSKASTGLIWPDNFINYTISGVVYGDKINTVSVPSIPAGGETVVEIPWYPPNPADFGSTDNHHFCLISRIQSPGDPMVNELTGINVSDNVRNNNNIAWKNVMVYDADLTNSLSLFIRGTDKEDGLVNISFRGGGQNDSLKNDFFKKGRAEIQLDPKFYQKLKRYNLLKGMTVKKNTLFITNKPVQLKGIPLEFGETYRIKIKLVHPERKQMYVDIIQTNSKGEVQGGERLVYKPKKK